jgi:glycine/D-amino acid oxidase-like deaminating enzyme
MTTDASVWIIVAGAALAGLIVATHAALLGWRAWLDLRRLEIEGRRAATAPSTGARIELADLRERIRKLEAIAAGVEL